MKPATILAKAQAESPEFGEYADVMLEAIPELSMPMLRDLYKHNAIPSEYFAHMERIIRAARLTPTQPKDE